MSKRLVYIKAKGKGGGGLISFSFSQRARDINVVSMLVQRRRWRPNIQRKMGEYLVFGDQLDEHVTLSQCWLNAKH